MNPLIFMSPGKSLKAELLIALSVAIFIIGMPVIAVIATTNVGALVDPGVTLYDTTPYPGDGYDFGQCTYWAAQRRAEIYEPVPNAWGNAATWAIRALLDGYEVDHTPAVGAIMQTPDAAGGLGHVAFVEAVDAKTGSWTISEMNYYGWDEVDSRTLLASAARNYSFIHLRVVHAD